MYLWDHEMRSLRGELSKIPPAQRLALALKTMDWTLNLMGPVETTEIRNYLSKGMRQGHEDLLAGREKITLPEEMLDAYEDLDAVADEPGTSQMLMAILACSDAPEGLSGEVLYGVLSFCYEALLDREDIPVYSLEAEVENARCAEVIAFQKQRVWEAVENSG
ncbi:hypothetical protein [Streptomyces californicus]|uniref:hypothetical protein n=1 Tax=Streptomyces californicus TaxID=67351 RepID=UPI0037B9E2D0